MAERSDILARLQDVFQEVFDDDEIVISDDMTADDLEEWDSVMHITLVVAVENEFGMQLNAAEVGKLENVGQMVNILVERATR